MNLKKIFLVLIGIFLMTGCADVKYNINISKKMKVEEEVFITGTNTYFANFYRNLPITIVEEYYNNKETMKPLAENGYTFEINKDKGRYPGILANKSFNSLKEYKENTVFINQVFEDISLIENDKLITLETKNFLPYVEDESFGRYPISNLSIDIKLPYVVTENNADSYNPKTNTFTWKIDSNTKDKEIKLTFDKSKIYQM